MARNKIGIIVFVTFLSTIAAILIVRQTKTQISDPWRFVPQNAAIIIQIDHPKNVFSILSSNLIWQAILEDSSVKKLNNFLNTVDSIDYENFSLPDKLFKSPLLITFQQKNNSEKITYLAVCSPSEDIDKNSLMANLPVILGNNYRIVSGRNNEIIVKNQSDKSETYLTINDGNLLFTNDYELFIAFAKVQPDQSQSGDTDQKLLLLRQTAGKNVDVRIFYNYLYICDLLPNYETRKLCSEHLAQFAGWTETDVFIKKEKLILSGYTFTQDSSNILSHFVHSDSVYNGVFKIIPADFQYLYSYSIKKNVNASAHNSDSSEDTNAKEIIGSLFCNKVSVVQLSPGYLTENQKFFFIQFKDVPTGTNVLNKISKKTSNIEISENQDFEIRVIENNTFFSEMLDQTFPDTVKYYFIVLDDFVVFSKTAEDFLPLILNYQAGNTIETSPDFAVIKENKSDNSALSLLINPELVTDNLHLTNELNFSSTWPELLIESLYPVPLEFRKENHFYYTSLILHFNEKKTKHKSIKWKSDLSEPITAFTALEGISSANTQDVLVVTRSNSINLFTEDGKFIWKNSLDGEPVGKAKVLKLKDKTSKILLSTATKIYCFNANGEISDGFPIQVNPEITNEILLAEIENDADFRLLFVNSKKTISCLSPNGKPDKKWQNPTSKNKVKEPIQRLLAEKKEYLFVTDIDQNVNILNNQGKSVIRLKKSPEKAEQSAYYVNKTNNKGLFLTTDQQGKLTYISAKGDLQHTEFGNFSPSHFFLYEDFDSNGDNDFIFIDKGKMIVFDRFKKVLFSFKFPYEKIEKPAFDSEKGLFVYIQSTSQLYLFGKDGYTITISGINSNIPVEIVKLSDNKYAILSVKKNTLICTNLELTENSAVCGHQ